MVYSVVVTIFSYLIKNILDFILLLPLAITKLQVVKIRVVNKIKSLFVQTQSLKLTLKKYIQYKKMKISYPLRIFIYE